MIDENYKLIKFWQQVDQYKTILTQQIAVYLNLFYQVRSGVVRDPTKAILTSRLESKTITRAIKTSI